MNLLNYLNPDNDYSLERFIRAQACLSRLMLFPPPPFIWKPLIRDWLPIQIYTLWLKAAHKIIDVYDNRKTNKREKIRM